MRIYFDVGAHDGTDGFNALGGKYDKCYAFEIDKRMISLIKTKMAVHGENYVLTEKAVGSESGKMTFKSYKKTNVGSLYHTNSESIKGREVDFEIVDEYEVDVITLADFCKENNIEKIDHLHIDTQGHDFEVIKGVGEYIQIVESGVLECYDENQKNLYLNTTNTLGSCKDYLESVGFTCNFDKQSNHDGNLKFKRL